MQQTMQQQRAKFALDSILKLSEQKQFDDNKRREFKSYIATLPAMIHRNGLGQAVAFYAAKGGTHGDIYALLSNWLCQEQKLYSPEKDLLHGITHNNMQRYRHAQIEAQALLQWLKRFANAYLLTAEDDSQGNSSKNQPENAEE